MVRVLYIGVDGGMFQRLLQGLGYINVIYTPAFVVVARVRAQAPPGIVMRIGVEMPEGIYETMLKELIHPGPFIRQVAG